MGKDLQTAARGVEFVNENMYNADSVASHDAYCQQKIENF